MNYQTNTRDCQAWKDEGLEMSTTNNEAAKLLDHAIDQMFCHVADPTIGGVIGTVDKMLEADPDFFMAKIFSIGVRGSCCRNSPTIAKLVSELEAVDDSKLNEREKLHRKASIEWATEKKRDACRTWEYILLQYPKDTIAILFSFYGYIITGQSRMLRDSLARTLPYWRESDFHYGYLQGYYAFGLEQSNQFVQAEKAVKKSLEINPDNTWGLHAYSHIFDATCRSQEGVDFLEENDTFLTDDNSLTCHLFWHQTVNLTELGHYDRVLKLYDDKILPTFKQTSNPFNLNDGVQALQRLEFEGINVGDRWEELYSVYKPMSNSHELVYDDMHLAAAMIKSKTGCKSKSNFFESMEDHLNKGLDTTYGVVGKRIGFPFAKGIVAYCEDNFEEACNLFIPVYKDIWELGGSKAQQDVFNQYVINACVRSPNQFHRRMARSLLHERKLFRPNSLLTDRVLAKLDVDH